MTIFAQAKMDAMNKFNVVELFAGVGGFRIGLDRAQSDFFQTIWSNQYEPATKTQHASRTYIARFGADGHINKDIALVKTDEIPNHDMLVGGFPCQDYSVARVLSQAEGIVGKKGVLWWEIHRILVEKGENKPQILFLENVDRLLQSPATQRGRDFAIILQSLSNLGYIVEWRVVNAAEYGMPQRRKRTYILAYSPSCLISKQVTEPTKWIFNDGIFAKAFPVQPMKGKLYEAHLLQKNPKADLSELSSEFNKSNTQKPFCNAGLMMDGKYWTYQTEPNYDGPYVLLKDILATGSDRTLVTEDYYISPTDLPKWEYLKGGKKEIRKTRSGVEFTYSEGSMAFPDFLDRPSRTIITSEGGSTPSRFKHIIIDPENGRYRRLIPLELERLNMFPDNHTIGETDTKRAFFMGNALVCGIITKVGEELYRALKS